MKEDIESVLSERGRTHGRYVDVANFHQDSMHHICKHLKKDNENGFERYQWFALDMIVGKISRIVNGDSSFSDHWKDIAGYAMLVVKEIEKDEE